MNRITTYRSLSAGCTSRKSTFLKQKPSSKMLKPKIYWWKIKACWFIKDIHLGPVMTKNRLILNKIKCLDCNLKKLIHYKKNWQHKF